MKYIFSKPILASFLFVSVATQAHAYFEGLQSLGEYIEKVDKVPVIEKLTNILPFAALATCLQQCPGQTVVLCTGFLLYALLKRDSFRAILRKCHLLKEREEKRNESPVFDDSLFVYQGDDEENVYDKEHDTPKGQMISDEQENILVKQDDSVNFL